METRGERETDRHRFFLQVQDIQLVITGDASLSWHGRKVKKEKTTKSGATAARNNHPWVNTSHHESKEPTTCPPQTAPERHKSHQLPPPQAKGLPSAPARPTARPRYPLPLRLRASCPPCRPTSLSLPPLLLLLMLPLILFPPQRQGAK